MDKVIRIQKKQNKMILNRLPKYTANKKIGEQ